MCSKALAIDLTALLHTDLRKTQQMSNPHAAGVVPCSWNSDDMLGWGWNDEYSTAETTGSFATTPNPSLIGHRSRCRAIKSYDVTRVSMGGVISHCSYGSQTLGMIDHELVAMDRPSSTVAPAVSYFVVKQSPPDSTMA